MHFSFIYLIPVVSTVGVLLAFIVSKTTRSRRQLGEPIRHEVTQMPLDDQPYLTASPTTTSPRLTRLAPLPTGPLNHQSEPAGLARFGSGPLAEQG